MGDSETDNPTAQPVHPVRLPSFCFDLTEVTVAAYRRCPAASCTVPDSGQYSNWFSGDRENHPVNNVDWGQARAYCAWAGKRLPTEAEWEYAARSSMNRIYPWGSDAPGSQLCWSGSGRGESGTCPVHSFPQGDSVFGVSDLAGNVAEWTADWYAPYMDGTTLGVVFAPAGPPSGTTHPVRGGGWGPPQPLLVRATYRRAEDPARRDGTIGFRCAQNDPRGSRL